MAQKEIDPLFEYMRTRGIADDTIQKLIDEKIDSAALPMMDDNNLKEFVPLLGDRIALRAFCEKNKAPATKKDTILKRLKEKLRKKRTSSGSDEDAECQPFSQSSSSHLVGNSNARKTQRKIEIGWLHECPMTSKFKQVRKQNGGGTRYLTVSKTMGKGELLEIAKELFFKDGISPKGKLSELHAEICDFRQYPLSDDINVGQLYSETKMNVLRFYLKTTALQNDISCKRQKLPDDTEEQGNSSTSIDELPWFDVGNYEFMPSTSIEQPDTPTITFGRTCEATIEYLDPDNTILDADVVNLEVETACNDIEVVHIRRSLIIDDMISAFKNENIMGYHRLSFRMVLPDGEVEAGTGTGVYRDALTEFWQAFYNKLTIGDIFKVPVIRHDYAEKDWKAVGRIIAKGWLDQHFFPISLAPPFLGTALFGLIEIDTKSSFLSFVPEAERQVIESAFKEFPTDTDELIDILTGYDCRVLPTENNLDRIISELGHKEIIQKPMFIAESMRPALAQLRNSLSKDDFIAIYENLHPTSKKVTAILEFPHDCTANQSQICTYLKRYIRSLDLSMLQRFLRFCTGSDVLSTTAISVAFSTIDGFQRRPVGHTCSNILEIPENYDSFLDFKQEFHEVLSSSVWVMDLI